MTMNVAEILRNCPEGTKLYSPIFGDVKLINSCGNFIKCSTSGGWHTFYSDGKYFQEGEVMLFPSKEQRDWSKFLIPFKDGDIIISIGQTPKYSYENVAIFEKYNNSTDNNKMTIHCQFTARNKFNNFKQDVFANNWRKATEKERKKFFERLHKEGYDFTNGTLVKRFKYGDVIAFYNETFGGYNIGIFDEYLNDRFCKVLCVTVLTGGIEIVDKNCKIGQDWDTKNARYANHAEKVDLLAELAKIGYEWKHERLVKIVKPTFELGDTITNGKTIVRIISITENFYGGYDIISGHEWAIPKYRIKDWELAKFDLRSLKPYDRVLVKSDKEGSWYPTLVSYVNSSGRVFIIENDGSANCVIPFEGNEYLIGKWDDPDPYYITWE